MVREMARELDRRKVKAETLDVMKTGLSLVLAKALRKEASFVLAKVQVWYLWVPRWVGLTAGAMADR